MAKAERIKIIEEIQKERGDSFLISYITSTRPLLEHQMGMEAIRIIYDQLRTIKKNGKELKIDLFLHSNGGEGTVPWKLVTLIKEFTKEFTVLIPYRAFSAATLTALGANRIIMHPMGILGPTDAIVNSEFSPSDPSNPLKKTGINAEDVTAYISLIKEDVGITHDDELILGFNKLAEQIHPLALGAVKRTLSQSRMMAKKLLSLHMGNVKEHEITDIVDNLTSKLHYHSHPINRKEAAGLGLTTIIDYDHDKYKDDKYKDEKAKNEKIEQLMWDLYLEYEMEMKMEEPFIWVQELLKKNPTFDQQGVTSITDSAKLAFIESVNLTKYYDIDYQILGQRTPQGQVNAFLSLLNRGWKTE